MATSVNGEKRNRLVVGGVKGSGMLFIALVTTCCTVPAAAHAWGVIWLPGADFATPRFTVRAGVSQRWGMVPEFRAAARDRTSGDLVLDYAPAGPVWLHVRGGLVSDLLPTGERRTGPDDLRLGTDVAAWSNDRFQWRIAWEVKLPNSSDVSGIGTDETDAILMTAAGTRVGPGRLAAVGGLGILGNPLQFANQDDVPLSWLLGAVDFGSVSAAARLGGAWRTARNPARMEVAGGVEGRCPLFAGVEGAVGLTPAAPDVSLRAWLGWAWGCPDGSRD